MRSPRFFRKIFSTSSNLYYKIFALHNAWEYWSIIVSYETHFWSMFLFLTPWKYEKIFCVLVFSGGRKQKHCPKLYLVSDVGLDQIISISNLILVTFIWLPMKALYWAYFPPGPWPFASISYHSKTMLWQ